jgi:vacuolar iron transporter family protein
MKRRHQAVPGGPQASTEEHPMDRPDPGRAGAAPLDLAQLAAAARLRADELATARMYRELAELDGERRELFLELAETEQRHADHWAAVILAGGGEPEDERWPLRHRLTVLAAQVVGVERVLPRLVRAEAAGRDRYAGMDGASPTMAQEEAEHGRRLALSMEGSVGANLARVEGRHRTGVGGSLRASVFGANDGLVSNFALIMGMAGGTSQSSVVLLGGVAGLVAGAGSMAAGEWISVRSQRELYERELEIERMELAEFPEDEQRELELIYRAKGLTEEQARTVAVTIMADPEVALDTMAREELGLDPDDLGSPWAAAISSFLAFALGAMVPLVPFLLTTGRTAVIASAILAGLALGLVGASLSIFTGRHPLTSGLRMVAIGGGAALVTYLIGSLVGVNLD